METERDDNTDSGSGVDYDAMYAAAQAEVIASKAESTAEKSGFDARKRAQTLIHEAEPSKYGFGSVAGREGVLMPRSKYTIEASAQDKLDSGHAQLLEDMKVQAEMRRDVSKLALRGTMHTLDQIMHGGEPFKTIAETGTSKGADHLDAERLKEYAKGRADFEKSSGMRINDDEPHVIYGFVEEVDTIGERPIADKYGEVEFILKDEVIERSTFTTDDSLNLARNSGGDMNFQPISFEEAIYVQQLKDVGKQRGATSDWYGGGYVEAQILGGLTKEDIAGVVINKEAILVTDREGQVVRDDLTELFTQAEALRAAAPDIELTLRIDIRNTFNRKAMLEFANAHPDINIMLQVDSRSPFLQTSPERSQADIPRESRSSEFKTDEYTLSSIQYEQQKARDRVEAAKVNLEIWQKDKIGLDELPSNLSLHLATRNYQSQ